jgi:uncharacterized protein YdhG (YjbR/CyaY superfamily)
MEKVATIDAYIKDFPAAERKVMQQFRKAILSVVPKAEQVIGYGIPTFKLNGKNLVHFGGFKKHLGFFPTPSAVEYFKLELSKYEGAKGSVQFPWEKPIPLALVKKIVKFRVKQVTENK